MRTLVKAQCGVPASNRFFFDDLFGKDVFDFNPVFAKTTTPSVNVKEDETKFSLEVAAPGLQKENFKVELEDNLLTISAEQKSETNESDEKAKFTRKEFSYSAFKRSFTLDEETVDAENIEAKYENGILHISIPKKVKVQEEKKAKSISVL
jgi:HSP20 family protein